MLSALNYQLCDTILSLLVSIPVAFLEFRYFFIFFLRSLYFFAWLFQRGCWSSVLDCSWSTLVKTAKELIWKCLDWRPPQAQWSSHCSTAPMAWKKTHLMTPSRHVPLILLHPYQSWYWVIIACMLPSRLPVIYCLVRFFLRWSGSSTLCSCCINEKVVLPLSALDACMRLPCTILPCGSQIAVSTAVGWQ